MEVLGGLDYICQGNETEQKLSNVMLFERILHVLNHAPFQQANRDFSCQRKWLKCDKRDAVFLFFLNQLVSDQFVYHSSSNDINTWRHFALSLLSDHFCTSGWAHGHVSMA